MSGSVGMIGKETLPEMVERVDDDYLLMRGMKARRLAELQSAVTSLNAAIELAAMEGVSTTIYAHDIYRPHIQADVPFVSAKITDRRATIR